LKLNSIELNSVHVPALKAEDDPLGSEDRSDTTDVDLTARFATALVTALFTALVTALFGERPNARKLPLARDTRAKPNAREKIPSPTRHLRAPTEFAGALNNDGLGRTSRGPRVSIVSPPFRFSGGRL
jgi:acyl transferase domain-containing protein